MDLSRALSPAPSYSALSWLETSILFPAKFADISVKATATQDDEKEDIRREKMAIAEIRRVLKRGGRVQIADIVLGVELPEDARKDIDLWTG